MVADDVQLFEYRFRKSGVPVVLTQAAVRKKQGDPYRLHLAFYSLCWSVFLVTGVPMLFLNVFDSLRQEGQKDHYTPLVYAALRPQPDRTSLHYVLTAGRLPSQAAFPVRLAVASAGGPQSTLQATRLESNPKPRDHPGCPTRGLRLCH